MVFEASGGHASGNKPSTERRRNSKGSHGRVKKKVKEEGKRRRDCYRG